jgi:hypothetical protein
MRAVKREEGGWQRSGAVKRKDDGQPSVVESAAVEHDGDSRVWVREWCGSGGDSRGK